MRKVLLLLIAVVVTIVSFAQISVTATSGTTGPTTYTTLGAAFTAINSGTHQGAITISVTANSTETAACVLNSSGAGSASYTSILIQPTTDGVSISGPTVTGRGLIELNGADNVTINGDNPNTAGTNRNLTITNTATATITYCMAIRIAAATSVITSADGNSIRNCIINGNATGLNTSSTTSTTGSGNLSYGIYAGGGASTTSATTAPSAIASASTTLGTGATASNLIITNNAINGAARGIAVQGSAATVFTGLTITNNVIGSSTGSTTTVYSMGITAQGSSNGIISNNTITGVESFLNTSLRGIDVGSISSVSGDAFTIDKNTISLVNARSTSTYGAYGINIAGGTGNVVTNNVVYGITGDMTAGGAFSATFGIFGIRVAANTNHKFYHNSVHLTGTRSGIANSSLLSASFAITGTGLTGIDVRNNIFSNTQTGGTTSLAYVSIFLPSGGTTSMNLTINNNAYFSGTTTASQGIAQVGATAGTGFYLASNFNSTTTSGSTNLRNYTSTLLTANTNNDNASLAYTSAAPFVSSTNLHINTGVTATQLESGGVSTATTGVTTDIDGQNRPGPTGSVNGGASSPDIGADEFDGVPLDATAPSISYTTLSNVATNTNRTTSSFAAITDVSGINTTAGTKPRLYFKRSTDGTMYNDNTNGTDGWKYVESSSSSSPFDFTIDYNLLNGGTGAAFGSTIQYFVVAQDLATTPNVGINSGTFAATPSSVALTSAAFPIGGTINSYNITTPLSGTYTVGTGGTYTTLKAFFDAVNAGVVGGNITAQIVGDCAETATAQLNQWVEEPANSNYTITISPSGDAARTISGAIAGGLVVLNGADRVTINGLNTGGNSLTINNTNTTASAVGIMLVSLGTGLGSTNNIITNTSISCGSNTVLSVGISVGGATAGSAGADNDNNTITNNTITKCGVGIYLGGTAATSTGGADNPVISGNIIGPSVSGTSNIGQYGIFIAGAVAATINTNTIQNITALASSQVGLIVSTNVTNASIASNIINNVTCSTSTAIYGLLVGTNCTGITIERNNISGVNNTNTSGYAARGIHIGTATASSNITIRNNSISNIVSYGDVLQTGGVPSFSPVGIYLTTTSSGINVYHNSINLYGSNTGLSAGTVTACLFVDANITVLDVRNNILANTYDNSAATASVDNNYAIVCAAANTAFTAIDFNNYAIGTTDANKTYHVGNLINTNSTSLNAFRTAFGSNQNSTTTSATFTSSTNLLPTTGNDLIGTNIASVTTDYNGTTRQNPPAMGAYEVSLPGIWSATASSPVWETPGNWRDNTVPGSGITVFIPSASTNMPSLASSPTLLRLINNGTLTIGSNTLTINGAVVGTGTLTGSATSNLTIGGIAGTLNFTTGGRTLQNLNLSSSATATLGTPLAIAAGVNSAVTLGNNAVLTSVGNLTLKSDNTGTARVASLGTGASISGTVNIERYIPGGRRAFRFFGHPFTAAIPLSQLMATNGANTGIDITGASGATNGFTTTTTNNPSAFNYTPSTGNSGNNPDPGWNEFGSATTSSWASKQGIRVLVRGTKGQGLDGNSYTPGATTVIMSGTLNDGSAPAFSLTSGTNSGFNLIANPLASQIDMQAVTRGGANVAANFWVWDPTSGTKGAYFNEPFATAATYRYLPLGSAFFAQTSSTGTITFPENAKVSNTPAALFRGTSAYGNNSIQLVLNDATGVKHDRILFFIDNNASTAKDARDGDKMTNPDINFYANSSNGDKLSIDTRPFADNTIIPLTLANVTANNSFVLVAADYNVDDNKDILLHDKKNNSYTTLNAGVSYSFTVDIADASSHGDRFELVMRNSNALPATFLNVTAAQKNAGIEVSWNTANETNMSNYEVEESTNGVTFAKTTTLTAKNATTNNYNWFDASVVNGDNYYRIKAVENNGSIKYSNVVKVKIGGKGSEFTVYPNPVKGGVVSLQMSNVEKGIYTVKIFNNIGQELANKTINHNGGSATQTIDLGKSVAAGTYKMQITNGTTVITKTVIVE